MFQWVKWIIHLSKLTILYKLETHKAINQSRWKTDGSKRERAIMEIFKDWTAADFAQLSPLLPHQLCCCVVWEVSRVGEESRGSNIYGNFFSLFFLSLRCWFIANSLRQQHIQSAASKKDIKDLQLRLRDLFMAPWRWEILFQWKSRTFLPAALQREQRGREATHIMAFKKQLFTERNEQGD